MDEPRLSNYSMKPVNSDFIASLQPPTKQILWIGCSDNSFAETTTLNLRPDEMLEHRNIGNMVIDGDLSCATTVKHAVVDLQVKHIIVCGHYGCGIARTASRDGLQGPWLSKLDSIHATHQRYIDQLPSVKRDRSFVELNVLEQLRSLRKFPEVANAMRRGCLHIHGLVYDPVSRQALSVTDAAGEC